MRCKRQRDILQGDGTDSFTHRRVSYGQRVSIDTIRYYERRRLFPHAGRASGGFRLYTPEAVERLRFIKQAQEIGFSLDEIGGLLPSGGVPACARSAAREAGRIG